MDKPEEYLDYMLPLKNGRRAILRFPRMITEEDHALLVTMVPEYLNMAKWAIVEAVADPETPSSPLQEPN